MSQSFHPPDDTPGLHTTADVFADLGRRLTATADTPSALKSLTEVAVDVVPGARWVSVTQGLSDRFTTMAASDPVADEADRLQYELGTGPCVDAVIEEAVFHSADLALDERWSSFGPQVSRDLGVRSVLSVRLRVEHVESDLNAALNLYGDRMQAFDAESRYLTTLLAAHAAVAVSAVIHREKARNLEHALATNREIGVAMGVLMATHHVTREQAFSLLRVASQNTNRKLRDVAAEVADTGVLELPERTSRATPRRGRS